MMETNNLGLQTELKAIQPTEFELMLDNLMLNVRELRESLASIGMTTLACSSKACNLTSLDDSMPDVCILDLLDWTDELANPQMPMPGKDVKSRARQLDSMIEMIMRKVEPIATAPDGRHELPFLMRGLAHPRVQVALEDLHTSLNKVANYEMPAAARTAA